MKQLIKKIIYKTFLYSLIQRYREKKSMELQKQKFRSGFQLKGNEKYYVHASAIIEKSELVEIGDCAEINEYVIIKTGREKVRIGKFTQINPFAVIYGSAGVEIGNNVMIAPHCMIASGNHDFRQTKDPIRFAGTLSKGPIVIEDNVWIGAGSTVLDGVRIGKEAVVAAGSVITKDIPPWAIVGGVPARVLGSRL